jgi:ABC-2 type transport system permease protein
MRWSRRELAGTGKVFSFTLAQFMKNKGNIISLVVLFLFALASMPVMTLLSGGNSGAGTALETVYLQDETGYGVTPEEVTNAFAENSSFAQTQVTYWEEGTTLEEGTALARFSLDASGGSVIEVETQLPAEDPALVQLQQLLTEALETARYRTLGVTEEQLNALTTPYTVEVLEQADYAPAGDAANWSTQYGVQLAYAILVMMVSVMAVSYIVRTVVEEKASRLVELLMVSVRPMALLLGKILAAMAFVLGLVLLLILGAVLSYFLCGLIWDPTAAKSALQSLGVSSQWLNLGAGTLIAVLISMVLAYLTFALLAGLSGSGCSEMEDMQSATSAAMLLIMVGYVASIFVSAFDSRTLILISCIFPILSVYAAPAQYIIGGIGFGTLCIAWLLQLVVIGLLLWFTARIYESLLIHRGGRITFKGMLRMAKSNTVKEVG